MMRRIIKAIIVSFLLLMVTSVMAVGHRLPAQAREESTQTQIKLFMRALQQINAKEEPNDDAETIFTYDEGDHIYVTGETPNGWYIVYLQGKTGYINKNVSQGIEIVQGERTSHALLEEEEVNIEALDDELTALEVENKLIAEGIARYLAEARRSRIWGVVIVLLVIGIFAVGIVSTVRAEKKNKKEDDIIDLDKG